MQIAEEEKAVFFHSGTILKRWKENDFLTVEEDNKLLHLLFLMHLKQNLINRIISD
jgi:hypothetical protein